MAARQPLGGQYFMPTVEKTSDDRPDFDSNLATVAPSLRKILQMNAQTSEEKFKVLDARDKLLKMIQEKDSSLKRGALVATCTDMCPEKERLLREYQGRGAIFEMTNFSKNSSFNHSLAVKEYARSSADQEEPLPQDLRPVRVLTMTMSHLLHNVVDYCELSDDNLEEWYMFMWDRTRALRKELTQQGVCSLESVVLVEQCARFHIHCAERLIDQDSSIYDDKINTENLTKCLQTLKYMYKDLRKEDLMCPNEPEFICYSLLLNLNNSSVFTELSGMPSSLLTSEQVKFALDVMTTWETKNYIRFFNLVKRTTYLNCCLLRRYFGEMRLYAIKTMIRSYCTKNYSPQILISHFVETLNFEGEEECENFLTHCHFNFHEVDGKTVVNFDRVLFRNPTTAMSFGRAFIFIEEKKRKPLSVIMAGGILPPRLFENHVPHSSFTPNGDLNLDASPQKELLSFFSSTSASSKMESAKPLDIFQEKEPTQSVQDWHSQKKDGGTVWPTSNSIFSFKENNTPPVSIFGTGQSSLGSVQTGSKTGGEGFPNAAGSFGNLFDSFRGSSSVKPTIFGNKMSSSFPSDQKSSFVPEQKPFYSTNFQSSSNLKPNSPLNAANNAPAVPPASFLFKNNSGQFDGLSMMGIAKKPTAVEQEAKAQEEREDKEMLEREKLRREKEEEEKRRKEEEERARILMEKKRLQEERERKEKEEIEKQRREEEERRKKEELARLEREERNRREEEARQRKLREANARHLEEIKRQEENKRKTEIEYKQKMDAKMSDLKKSIQKWKTKAVFDKWRMKTWASIEDRKMKEYFKEVKLKYPPVCTEEQLDGNPYGLLIPSCLTFEKFRDWRKEPIEERQKKLMIVNDDLPLLKVDRISGNSLEELAKRLGSKLDPFPWKLVISVPDNAESPAYWKSIETFVEMHFVEDFDWRFGFQKGPLCNRGGSRGNFRFRISIRRVRGSRLFEGSEPNIWATTGSNALIFFISERGNEITRERFRQILRSRAPEPKIPVIVIVVNGQSHLEHFRELLNFKEFEASHISKYFVTWLRDGKQELIKQLSQCLRLSALHSAPPSPLRVNKFSKFFSGPWIDSLWRRVEIGLSNFKITLKEPKILLEFYNSCIEELEGIFLDKKNDQFTILGEEFSDWRPPPPLRGTEYDKELKSLLCRLKLPHWPSETPKSCHQLNYRIHQYCKKVTGQKSKLKNLKWVLYRIIRQSLSWKGLDIYCDEDIYEILMNFPWIRVFQEISRAITRQLCEEIKDEKDLAVIYDLERVEKFSFESSFIGKFLRKPRGRPSEKWRQYAGEEEEDDSESNPCLEKDSVLYAYSAAIERENNKRKREECMEESLDALFLSPVTKRIVLEEEEPKSFDFSGIGAHFQSLDERLDGMKKQMAENFKLLTDIQSQIQ